MVAAATTFDVPTWLGVVVTIFGVVGTVGAAVAVIRQYAIKASLATIIEANAELRKANDDLRLELNAERQARANLEGKLEVFTQHFAQQIIDVVTRTLEASRTPRTRKDDQ
jgi:hypothetical protein